MSKQVDEATVHQTLRFLGKQLRLHQFILRGQNRQRKIWAQEERKTRKTLQQLRGKVQRELDAHPDLFRKFTGMEPGQ